MNDVPGCIVTVGTRLCFDGGLWEVAEMTAAGVVSRCPGRPAAGRHQPPARRPGYPPAGHCSRAACPCRAGHERAGTAGDGGTAEADWPRA